MTSHAHAGSASTQILPMTEKVLGVNEHPLAQRSKSEILLFDNSEDKTIKQSTLDRGNWGFVVAQFWFKIKSFAGGWFQEVWRGRPCFDANKHCAHISKSVFGWSQTHSFQECLLECLLLFLKKKKVFLLKSNKHFNKHSSKSRRFASAKLRFPC